MYIVRRIRYIMYKHSEINTFGPPSGRVPADKSSPVVARFKPNFFPFHLSNLQELYSFYLDCAVHIVQCSERQMEILDERSEERRAREKGEGNANSTAGE